MKVFRSTSNGVSTYFNKISDAQEELALIFEHGIKGDKNEYEILEMTEEDFLSLPEVE